LRRLNFRALVVERPGDFQWVLVWFCTRCAPARARSHPLDNGLLVLVVFHRDPRLGVGQGWQPRFAERPPVCSIVLAVLVLEEVS